MTAIRLDKFAAFLAADNIAGDLLHDFTSASSRDQSDCLEFNNWKYFGQEFDGGKFCRF